MSLRSAWSVGLSGLTASSDQIALVSRNVSNAGDISATRRVGEQVTSSDSHVRVGSIERVADAVLLDGLLSATARYREASVVSDAVDRLGLSASDSDLKSSPAAMIAALEGDLRIFANDPSALLSGARVVETATNLVASLNSTSSLVNSVRTDAEAAISRGVDAVNSLLNDLTAVNRDILSAAQGVDITDALDNRDTILKQLSEHLGIRVVPRGERDITIYTDGGVVLFETLPREVSFSPAGAGSYGSSVSSVSVDGVPITGSRAVMPSRSGSIIAHVRIRDDVAFTYQTQLDEIARGLIASFADPDRSGGSKPHLPGLFTWSGGTVPTISTVVPGLAALIRVNSAVDPSRGGDLRLLRDGGASAPLDPDYRSNDQDSAGFSNRLRELISNLSTVQSFAPVGLSRESSLKEFSSESAGWLSGFIKSSTEQLERRSAVYERASERLLSKTGINLDQEMSDLLKFERSFQASSRLIATVDQMIKTILEAVR